MLLPPMEFDPVFLGGEGRSGTTLLRVMLDAHPSIACGPESHFLVDQHFRDFHKYFRDTLWRRGEGFGYEKSDLDDLFRDFARGWFETYMKKRGKRRWADKTPQTIHCLPYLWELFPTARFVHLIRDGRDVACSIIPQNWGPSTVEEAAERWVDCVWKGVIHRADTERYSEVRYEDLVRDPEAHVRRVLAWIGEEWDACVLDYHRDVADNPEKTESSAEQVARPLYTSSLGRWQRDLKPKQVKAFEKIAGETLEFLGYELAS